MIAPVIDFATARQSSGKQNPADQCRPHFPAKCRDAQIASNVFILLLVPINERS